MLLDPSSFSALLSDELEGYMDYNMGLVQLKRLLPADTKVLQVNGPWLEFTRLPVPGSLVTEFADELKKDGILFGEDLAVAAQQRIPTGRLYRHQQATVRAILAGKNVVLPHPTGSGKTEAFLLPIMQFLLHQIREEEHYGLGCLMIFPMKALENDQRDRLKRFLFSLESRLDIKIPWIGVYDGDTPSKADFATTPGNEKREDLREYREICPKCEARTLHYNMGASSHLLRCDTYTDEHGNTVGCGYPEDLPDGIPWIRTTREDMRVQHYPNLLITNPEALDFRLLSFEDQGVFTTKMERVIVVVDEAHAYSAGSALSLRFILSRLEETIRSVNRNPKLKIQYVVASATLDDPNEFARRLVPWAEFEVVPFHERSVPFESKGEQRRSLKGPIGLLDADDMQWLFRVIGTNGLETLVKEGMSPEEARSVIGTAMNLGIVMEKDGVLKPGLENVSEAFQLHQLGRSEESYSMLSQAITGVFLQLAEAESLYSEIRKGSKRLDWLVDWWRAKFKGYSARDAALTIAGLVFLGRRLGIWEERWHTFVKAPTGAAACTGKDFHFQRLSEEEPLPPACPTCSHPVFELWTCSSCGELYDVVYQCSNCATLYAATRECCGKLMDDSNARIVQRTAVGQIDEISQVRDFLLAPKDGCVVCSGDVLPIRRRTELIIDLSVSLMGWFADDKHRKFLLFADGRAASERIGRDFNNIEQVIWAERLLYDILAKDPTRPKFGLRTIPEVRKRLFSRVFSPYQVLRRLLRPLERDLLDQSLRFAAHRALGRSHAGRSRLFERGLVGYGLDDLSEKMQTLGLEGVLPRVLDVMRMREPVEGGLKKQRLIDSFLATKGDNAKFKALMAEWAGRENEKIELALEVLAGAGWIRRQQVGSTETLFMGTGAAAEGGDPYEVPRDIRKVSIPLEVWRCRVCGLVRWYPSELCEDCGNPLTKLTHDELLKEDYFARILAREPRPIVAAIHRAGLASMERKYLEERFRSEKDSIHFLSATPTLELGIDIGTLSFVLLAGIPPTRTSYIQRVGRAGRRRAEGAVCITFAYSTPVDRYYFRNPEALVSMRAGHIPVQKLSVEQLEPHLWSAVFDGMASRYSDAAKRSLAGGISAREVMDGTSGYSAQDLRKEMARQWSGGLSKWVRSVGKRAILPDVDHLTTSELDNEVENLGDILNDEDRFNTDVVAIPTFIAHKAEVERLHTNLRERLLELQRLSVRSDEQQRELDRLEIQDRNLQEYKKNEMNNAPLLMYLHGAGTLPSARGIGSSVPTYDLTYVKRTVDDRETGRAISDRFPGALVSRQGSIYRIKKVVYDPTRAPTVNVCGSCDRWLRPDEVSCPDDPSAKIESHVLNLPVVSFALMTRNRTLETRGVVQQLIRPLVEVQEGPIVEAGRLTLHLSKIQPVDVATWCETYDLFEGGRRQKQGVPILECGNCGSEPGDNCCAHPDPQKRTQGLAYSSRGLRIDLGEGDLDRALTQTTAKSILGPLVMQGHHLATQSLANASVNAIATVLGIEPSMLDVTLSGRSSFWLFEPIEGGYGILEDLVSDTSKLAKVFAEVKDIIRTREDHLCARYCDQCLMVPRYSHEELDLLHRPFLEWLLTGSVNDEKSG